MPMKKYGTKNISSIYVETDNKMFVSFEGATGYYFTHRRVMSIFSSGFLQEGRYT